MPRDPGTGPVLRHYPFLAVIFSRADIARSNHNALAQDTPRSREAMRLSMPSSPRLAASPMVIAGVGPERRDRSPTVLWMTIAMWRRGRLPTEEPKRARVLRTA